MVDLEFSYFWQNEVIAITGLASVAADLLLYHYRPSGCCHGPSALPPQAFGLTSGKGGLVRLVGWTANSSFWSGQNALSNVVGQTPSFCFAEPLPSSGPLVLSLLFARKPVAAQHYRFAQPSPNILPRASRRAFRGTTGRFLGHSFYEPVPGLVLGRGPGTKSFKEVSDYRGFIFLSPCPV